MSNRAQPSRLVDIDASHAGQRIDNFLLVTLKGVPKSHVYRLLRTGQVRVNKGRIKPAYRLQSGDIVRIPPLSLPEGELVEAPGSHLCERIRASFLYEDDDLLVINKPSGIAVHGGSGIKHGVIEILRAIRPDLGGLELVHRLDRQTSGCLLLAKNRATLLYLHDILREHKIDKRYLALLMGQWRGGKREVNVALQNHIVESGERMVKTTDEGKEAISFFHPRRVYPQATLVEVTLMTGRMHQIRVHAQHMGHPVAGDDKYGDDGFNRQMRVLGLKRLFLHACAVEFVHPLSQQKILIEAPLSEELQQVLNRLNQQDVY